METDNSGWFVTYVVSTPNLYSIYQGYYDWANFIEWFVRDCSRYLFLFLFSLVACA